MSLQAVFYVVSIIFMCLCTLLVVCMILLLWFIKNKINQIHTEVKHTVTTITDSAVKPFDMVANIGYSLVDSLTQTVKKLQNKSLPKHA